MTLPGLSSLRWKLGAGAVTLVLAIAIANVVVLSRERDASSRIAAQQAIHGALESFERLERTDTDKLATALEALVANPTIADRFAARDRPGLYAIAAPIFAELKRKHRVTHWYFLDAPPTRTCFLRVHQPSLVGDRVDRVTFTKSIQANGIGSGKELGKTGFALRVVRPFVRNGALLGYIELGEETDHFLAEMRTGTKDEFILVLEKHHLDEVEWAAMRKAAGRRNEWNDLPAVVVADATLSDTGLAKYEGDLSMLPDDGLLLDMLEKDGRWFARGLVPVRDAAGRKVGGLFVLHDITALRASMSSTTLWSIVTLSIIAVIAVAISIVAARSIARPIEHLTAAAAAMSRGDFAVRVKAVGDDEIGRLSRSFAGLADGFRGLLADLQRTGDMLGTQAEQLLRRTAEQASGAAQQAAAIQETSTTVSEISQTAELAKAHAERVIDATARSEALSRDGQDAVAQVRSAMESLSAQVGAIAHANAAVADQALRVGQIVEQVKDVAEQSNVLALNASIEASRAGEAGRGFTVVASEIRQLSDQSRAAALEVRKVVSEIQTSAGAALDAAQEGNRRATEAIGVLKAASESISGLSEAMQGSGGAARDIAEHTRQQSIGVAQVAAAMNQISAATSAGAEATREIERASGALTELSKALRSTVGRYRA